MSESRFRRLRDRATGPATLINEGCRISGMVATSGDLHVVGQIDGECDVAGCLMLAEQAFWSGTIRSRDVIIAGHVEGDIVASGNVEITSTARITGSVEGDSIAVAEGAIVEGVMKTASTAAPVEFFEKRSG